MIPQPVTDTIALLREERVPLAARLDAIDLAIDNLTRLYGIHGAPQPLPFRPEKSGGGGKRRIANRGRVPHDNAAQQRRDRILAVLGKTEGGVTIAELRRQTPKMALKDRSNALSILKTKGEIRRSGKLWVCA